MADSYGRLGGFAHANASRILIFLTLASSAVVMTSSRPLPLFAKLLLHNFAFSTLMDTVCGASLLYTFRLFERRMSTAKFVKLIVVSTLLTNALQFAYASRTRLVWRTVAQGPYAPVFACFWLFLYEVPALQAIDVFGVKVVNDKSLTYCLLLRMALYVGKAGFISALCALTSGLLMLALGGASTAAAKPLQRAPSHATVPRALLAPTQASESNSLPSVLAG